MAITEPTTRCAANARRSVIALIEHTGGIIAAGAAGGTVRQRQGERARHAHRRSRWFSGRVSNAAMPYFVPASGPATSRGVLRPLQVGTRDLWVK